jgi:hypothetical protein
LFQVYLATTVTLDVGVDGTLIDGLWATDNIRIGGRDSHRANQRG